MTPRIRKTALNNGLSQLEKNVIKNFDAHNNIVDFFSEAMTFIMKVAIT